MNRLPSVMVGQTDWLYGRPRANRDIQRLAQEFGQEHGLLPVLFTGLYAMPNYLAQGAVADAYDRLPLRDDSTACVACWTEFERQIGAQWAWTKAKGFVFKAWLRDDQPYETADDLVLDVRRGQLFYGLSEDGAMDKLLALHDLYGHAAGGFGFGPRGEFNTWLAHMQMFDGRAVGAMTTRYRGQNAWTHYGAHLYDAQGRYLDVPSKDRPDPPFKRALLPSWAWE